MNRFRFRPSSSRLISLTFLLLAMGAGAALLAAGCGSTADSSGVIDIGTGQAATVAKGPIQKSDVENIVTRKLGDAGIQGQPVIRAINITPEGNGVFVDISLNRTSSCHPGALVGTGVTMTQQVVSAVFRYPNVNRAQLSLYGLTEEAKDKDKKAVSITITRENAAKIDWFQFNEKTVASLVNEFWLEPSVLANYQQYGSAPITDDATRKAANGGVDTPAPNTTTPAQ